MTTEHVSPNGVGGGGSPSIVPPPGFEPPAPERYTDVGNAKRLVAAYGEELRYVPAWDTWLVWDTSRWRRDERGEVVERAKAIANGLWRGVGAETDSDRRKQLIRWAQQSEGAAGIRNMVSLARSHPGIPVMPDELDANPWLLNVANGTLDLRTGTLRPACRADLLTKLSPVTHDPDAQAPAWARFLEQVVPDDEVREFVRRAAGYALTGDVSEQVLFFAHGGGANGKSTLFETLLAMLGDYGRQAEPDLLLARNEAHPTGMADLQGARLVVASEIDEGRRLAEATVKQLTGDTIIKARFMRQDFFEFTATHKLFLHANHRPVVRGTDHAMWRRLRLVPFTVTIPRSEQDKSLPGRLLGELPGILRWALEGCLAWRSSGLTEPEAVRVATSDYQAEMDVLGAFLSESCVELEVASVSASQLYHAYTEWCDESGERALSQRRLGMALSERGFERRKYGSANRWHWFGIGLVTGGGDEPLNPSDPEIPFDLTCAPASARTGDMGSMGSSGPSQAGKGHEMGSSMGSPKGPSHAERLPYKDGE